MFPFESFARKIPQMQMRAAFPLELRTVAVLGMRISAEIQMKVSVCHKYRTKHPPNLW